MDVIAVTEDIRFTPGINTCTLPIPDQYAVQCTLYTVHSTPVLRYGTPSLIMHQDSAEDSAGFTLHESLYSAEVNTHATVDASPSLD